VYGKGFQCVYPLFFASAHVAAEHSIILLKSAHQPAMQNTKLIDVSAYVSLVGIKI
jgi:hypothetical protein